MKKYCNFKCKCKDCICFTEQDGKWFCDELSNFCKNIKMCDE